MRLGSYISATNLGPMGWAIPPRVEAKSARPELPLVVVTGDGYHADARHGRRTPTRVVIGIPAIFVVINNAALGNVRLKAV